MSFSVEWLSILWEKGRKGQRLWVTLIFLLAPLIVPLLHPTLSHSSFKDIRHHTLHIKGSLSASLAVKLYKRGKSYAPCKRTPDVTSQCPKWTCVHVSAMLHRSFEICLSGNWTKKQLCSLFCSAKRRCFFASVFSLSYRKSAVFLKNNCLCVHKTSINVVKKRP